MSFEAREASKVGGPHEEARFVGCPALLPTETCCYFRLLGSTAAYIHVLRRYYVQKTHS